MIAGQAGTAVALSLSLVSVVAAAAGGLLILRERGQHRDLARATFETALELERAASSEKARAVLQAVDHARQNIAPALAGARRSVRSSDERTIDLGNEREAIDAAPGALSELLPWDELSAARRQVDRLPVDALATGGTPRSLLAAGVRASTSLDQLERELLPAGRRASLTHAEDPEQLLASLTRWERALDATSVALHLLGAARGEVEPESMPGPEIRR